MRFFAVAALAAVLAACGGSDGADQFAAGNSQLSTAQIDAALGPADQNVQDASPADLSGDDLSNLSDDSVPANNSGAAASEDER